MEVPGDDNPASPPPRDDGRPRLVGRAGSLDAFWLLMEPVLARMGPRRLCEIGVDRGIFTSRLLAWVAEHGGTYVGIDPAPDPAVAASVRPPHRLILDRSLEVLPTLEPCEAYFIDGDHNYHTVLHELALIARAAPAAGPVVFAHDVGWPWARRDMYHAPATIPPAARQPASAELGVSLDGDALVSGGVRSPGRYEVARHAGGERNGVLTAIEDFLISEVGCSWQAVIVPLAYGLAILYRPDAVSAPCRDALAELGAACRTMGDFLESYEANFQALYLYAEAAKSQVAYWTGDDQPGRAAYEQLQRAYQELQGAYQGLTAAYTGLSAHGERLMQDYHRLLEAYQELERAFHRREAT